MLKVLISNDSQKLRKQAEALKYLIETDTNEKDKAIHAEALEAIEKSLKNT
ncbi:hypothetical protein ACLM5H_24645 [Fredinandcohnia humi]